MVVAADENHARTTNGLTFYDENRSHYDATLRCAMKQSETKCEM
jgi:aromatic ring-opening dioxygenase LigB subunit